MNEPAASTAPTRASWPRAAGWVGVFAVLVGGAVWMTYLVVRAPEGLVRAAGAAMADGGNRMRSVAQAFQQGTIRTEFLSQSVELSGATHLQFATLKQGEVFKREETGSIAWGAISLPKVVVEAQAPVEYSYYVDLEAPWKFERADRLVTVYPPPIMAATPALDVSALTFYTLEGSIWRDDHAVREKLRRGLTAELLGRAIENRKLVREMGRRRIGEFVQKWLGDKFSDGRDFEVKVVFPDEAAARGTPAPQ